MSTAWICICRCAAVCRLEKLKDLIIPHLQIGPSRLPDLCCQRSLDHFVTICLGLHLQAQLKSGVGPDLRIYHTAWLLGCQDQMYTKASSDPGILAARMDAEGNYGEKVLSLTASLNHGRIEGDPFIRMDGRQVFRLAVEGLVDSAREVAGLACVRTEDVALFVPHQANLRIMTMVAAKLGIPEDRMVKTVAEHGNTSAASVPLALDRAVRSGMVKPGELVLLQGVGAGMAWGSALIRW